jgi:hypothetical protein
MLSYKRLLHIHKIKKTLDVLAYFSLFSDIAIVLINFFMLESNTSSAKVLDFWFTISLAAEVLFTLILLLILALLYHYDSIEWFLVSKYRSRKRGK